MAGKLIVIDGVDGSGKSAQTELLVKHLKDEGYEVEMADFPQYGKKSAGLVEEYLNGKYGSAEEVGPYRASIFYAADRYDASFQLKEWLEQGKIIISNRYVTASMGHQGGKIKDEKELTEFLEWLHNLEYNIFDIPMPDLNIILHVTPEMSQKLVDKKSDRKYTNGKKRDIHEADIDHLRAAEKTYLKIADQNKDFFKVIESEKGGKMRSIEEIAEEVWQTIQPIIKS